MSTPAAECPAEESLLAFARGRQGDADRLAVIEHLDACPVCREVVVEVARGDEAEAATTTEGVPSERSTCIGRYEIVRPIGAGAMGVVFEARDAELDRRVALKLLRRTLGDREDRRLEQRLLGEARALARLAHPNVVAAFEVARHDGELYLVMELVEGPTVTGWLEAAPRAVPEVLALMIQAGRGLAAAHAASIVHRDFKLDNVLVGADGRARVTDFGLASGTLSGPTPQLHGTEMALTMTGALAGTPAFMAPELLRGGSANEASDQFAFAVSLWYALFGVRPFRGDSIAALLAEIERAEPRAPVGRRVPARLRDLVRRGLAADPAARWPSLPAMLDQLERVARPKRGWIVATGLVAALGLVAATAVVAGTTRDRGKSCALTDELADALWTPEVAVRVETSMRAAAPARGAEITAQIAHALGGWRERWRIERTAACRTGGASGAARVTCLELQLRQVGTVVRLFGEADAALAERAIETARRLPEPSTCLSAGAGATPDRGPVAATLARRLADALALHRVARFAAARDEAAAILAEAEAAGLGGVQLDALLLLAQSQSDSGQREVALATFRRAIGAALARDDHHALAEALVHLVSVHAAGGELAAHTLAESMAAAALARAGDDPELAAMLAMGRCRIGRFRPAAEYDRGVAACDDAARTWRALRGAEAPELAWVENQLGMLAVVAGRPAEALPRFRRFEELSLRSHGPGYVNIDVARVNAAGALVELGRHAEAEPIVRDLVSRRDWGSAYINLGKVLRARGAHDEAIAAFRQADRAGKTHGFGNDRCNGLIGIAEVEADRGDRKAVETALAEAEPVCAAHAVPDAGARLERVRTRLAGR